PSTLAGGPTREREVVERHHHLQAQALGVHEQSEIAIERGVVPMAFGGLEPAPLEAQAMRVLTELRRRAEVFFGAPVPPLRGLADARAITDRTGASLPIPPIVVVRSTFDLMGGSRGTPKESWREAQCVDHGAEHAWVALGSATRRDGEERAISSTEAPSGSSGEIRRDPIDGTTATRRASAQAVVARLRQLEDLGGGHRAVDRIL